MGALIYFDKNREKLLEDLHALGNKTALDVQTNAKLVLYEKRSTSDDFARVLKTIYILINLKTG